MINIFDTFTAFASKLRSTTRRHVSKWMRALRASRAAGPERVRSCCMAPSPRPGSSGPTGCSNLPSRTARWRWDSGTVKGLLFVLITGWFLYRIGNHQGAVVRSRHRLVPVPHPQRAAARGREQAARGGEVAKDDRRPRSVQLQHLARPARPTRGDLIVCGLPPGDGGRGAVGAWPSQAGPDHSRRRTHGTDDRGHPGVQPCGAGRDAAPARRSRAARG